MQTRDEFFKITHAQLVSPLVGAGTNAGVDQGPSVEFDQRIIVLSGDPGFP